MHPLVLCFSSDFFQRHPKARTGKLTLRTNHQTPPLLSPSVNRFNNVNQLLLVLEYPVQFVVVPRPEIAHHVLVAEEEHQCHRVVELVHLLEIGDLVQIAYIEDGEVFDTVGDSCYFW